MKIEQYNGQKEFLGFPLFTGDFYQFEGFSQYWEPLITEKINEPKVPCNYEKYVFTHTYESNSTAEESIYYPKNKISVFGYRRNTYLTDILLSDQELGVLYEILATSYNCFKTPKNIQLTDNIVKILHYLFPDKKIKIQSHLSESYGVVFVMEADNVVFALEQAGFNVEYELYDYGNSLYISKSLFKGKGKPFREIEKPFYDRFYNGKYNIGYMHELKTALVSFYSGEITPKIAAQQEWIREFLGV